MYMGAGINFSSFKNAHMPGPLASNECRQYVQVGEFPDGSKIHRSIIRNLVTKEKRWELPDILVDGVPTETSLHTFIDRASIGAPFTQWLYQGKKVEGSCNYDPWHIFASNFDCVFSACETSFAKREANIAYNVLHNPYHTQAALGQLKGCFADIHKQQKENNQVYQLVYPRICRNRGIPEAVMLDPSHEKVFWLELQRSGCVASPGELSKLGRWNQHHDKHALWRPHRSTVLIPMTTIGIRRKWYADISKSPVNGFFLEDYTHVDNDEEFGQGPGADADGAEEDGPLPAASSGDDPLRAPRGVKASNEALRKKRQSHHNTVDFSAHIFGDDEKMRKLDVHWEVADPLVLRFKLGLTACKTTKGSFEYWLGIARGALSDDVDTAWAKLTDQAVLLKLDLLPSENQSPAKVKADADLCQLFLDALRHTSRQFGMWEMEFTFGLPFQFFRLLSSDEVELATAALLYFIYILRLITFYNYTSQLFGKVSLNQKK